MVDDGGVIRKAQIPLMVVGAMLVALALAGVAQARSTSASGYSLVHLTGTKHKGEMVLTVRVHMDREVGRTCPVRVRVAGPTRRVAVIRGSHRTRAYERTRGVLDLRTHLTRSQVRKVFGKRPSGKVARVTIVVGSRTDQCFAPGLRSATPTARSGPSATTITLRPTDLRAPLPSRAVFAPNFSGQAWLDVMWGWDLNTGDIVPYVESLAVPAGTVAGCASASVPNIFNVVVPRRGMPMPPPWGPGPAPPSGLVQTDGAFAMDGESFWGGNAECWPGSTVTGSFSAVPNASGAFPGNTTVTATWATEGSNPQTGTVTYRLQVQSTCSFFGPRRCS